MFQDRSEALVRWAGRVLGDVTTIELVRTGGCSPGLVIQVGN